MSVKAVLNASHHNKTLNVSKAAAAAVAAAALKVAAKAKVHAANATNASIAHVVKSHNQKPYNVSAEVLKYAQEQLT